MATEPIVGLKISQLPHYPDPVPQALVEVEAPDGTSFHATVEELAAKGPQGDDALETAKKNDPEIETYDDWVAKLKGTDGDDAITAWLKLPGNEGKTITDYNAFIKGEDGANGKDAVEAWLARPGNEGKTQADYDAFYKGKDGLGAFEDWQARPGNEDKTEADYDAALKGADGRDSLQVWLDRPENEGKTEADYDAFYKGKDGQDAALPAFMGVVTTLPNPATTPSNEVYFKYDEEDDATHFFTTVDGAWVDHGNFQGPRGFSSYEIAQKLGFIGTEEEYEASLHGQDGIGLRILGSLPDEMYLPTQDQVSGDTFIIKEKMYVWDTEKWSPVGQVGPKGKDAYEEAVTLGFTGTRAEWIASLKGDDAITAWLKLPENAGKTVTDFENAIRGSQGLDALQTWLARPGNSGKTQDDYDLFYRGPRGKDALTVAMENDENVTDYASWRESLRGDPAQTVSILGALEDITDLPATGEPGTGWVIDGDVYGWDTLQNKFVFFSILRGPEGREGKDALQVVMANDETVTNYAEWQAKLKGAQGDDAYVTWTKIPGNEGKTQAEYNAFNKGAKGDDIYTWWLAQPENAGKGKSEFDRYYRGQSLSEEWFARPGNEEMSQNDFDAFYRGLTGLSAYDYWLTRPGNAGKTPEEYEAFIKGETGADALAVWLARPENAGKTQDDYDAFYRGEDLYQNWAARPENDGKTRDDFDAFYRGEDLRTEWFARPENAGKTEDDYDEYFRGKDGVGFIPDQVIAEGGALPGSPTEGLRVRLGDVAYVYRDGEWDNLGPWAIKGDEGKDALAVVMENDAEVESYADWQAKLKGATGDSAFEAWKKVPGNENKTQADYDAFNKGATGDSYVESWLARPENDGKSEADLDASLKAKNPYELWLEIAGNEGKSEAEYQEYLRAKNNYEVWVALPANVGKSEAEYFATLKAKDNYELWLEQAGNAGKTEQEFLDSLKALNNYQLWLLLPGNAGKTEAEYQESLAGEDGENGSDGVSFIPDVVVDEGGELPASPTEGLKVNFAGIAYIYRNGTWDNLGTWRGVQGVQGNPGKSFLEVAMEADPAIQGWEDLRLATKGDPGTNGENGKNAIDAWFLIPGNEEKTMADYQEYFRGRQGVQGDVGPAGAGLQIRDQLASVDDLPASGVFGDAYLIGRNYHFWSETQSDWIDGGELQGPQGDKGNTGDDAITAWFALPGNENKTQLDYENAIRGPQGLDQYETARKYDPTITSYNQWVTKIRGEKGDRGNYIITEEGDPGPVTGLVGDLYMNKITKQYFRKVSSTLWAPQGFFGGGDVHDAPNDGKKKVRLAGAWTDLPFDAITADGVFFGTKDGWKVMDTYDVKTQVINGNASLVPANVQVYHIDLSASRAITVPNFTKAGRTMTLVLILHGNAGLLNITGRVNWGTAGLPEFGAGYTVLTLVWDEVGNQWLGSGGSSGTNLAA